MAVRVADRGSRRDPISRFTGIGRLHFVRVMNNTPRELALSTSKPSAAGNLRVSPVTLFELTALHTLRRLRLTRAPDAWMREALDAGGIRIAELSRQTAIGAGMIPRTALSDPLDRLLVATAQQLHATFLTSDTRILDFAATAGHVRVQNAGK